MKTLTLSVVFIVLFATACSGTFDIGLEHQPTATALPAAATQAPINTPVSTLPLPAATATFASIPTIAVPATQVPNPTLASSATPLPSQVPAATATTIATSATSIAASATSIAASATSIAASATTIAASATLAPSQTPAPTINPLSINYIDDRSTPSQVIVSLFNAVNRQEYLRAYNYWRTPDTTLGNFTSYANGYADTAAVDLVFGLISGDPGMSQVYYTVPVILKTTLKNGTRINFAACYVVHETNPGVYGAPPIDPMSIDRGTATVSNINANNASVLAAACSGYPTGSNPAPASGTSLNIDKNNFLDNRSGPIETISSFLNALNLKQYVRAYSYFQVPATFPGPYDPFAAGYADTDTVTVSFGNTQSQGAAGNIYYKVPLAMKVITTSSTLQTFVGCYTLHLAQPGAQYSPPFQPLGILSGKFKKVDNSANINALLPAACN